MHNIEHADAYLLWSEKVSDHETLSQTLVNISTESIKVNDLLNEAITQINNELAKTG